MPFYPPRIHRCHHIKVNGIQCGSPALRDETYCYFHSRCHNTTKWASLRDRDGSTFPGLPTLEDANSIQVGLAEVMRLLVTKEIDHRTAALLLYAMQTASANLRWTSLEPKQPTQVVIDRDSVANRPIGATAWSKEEGREYDEIPDDESKEEELVDGMTAQDRRDLERWVHGTADNARNPNLLEKPRRDREIQDGVEPSGGRERSEGRWRNPERSEGTQE